MTATPTLYVKGDETRFAYTPADVVSLKFKGFKPATDVANDDDTSYADLRKQAKSLGIKAKGDKATLAAAVVKAQEDAAVAAGAQTTVDEAIADAEGKPADAEPSALEQVTTDTEATA